MIVTHGRSPSSSSRAKGTALVSPRMIHSCLSHPPFTTLTPVRATWVKHEWMSRTGVSHGGCHRSHASTVSISFGSTVTSGSSSTSLNEKEMMIRSAGETRKHDEWSPRRWVEWEGIVRGGKDVVVSLHGRGSFTRFTCLFLEWMRWGYETEPKGTASIAHFIHLSWLLPSGLYVCRERKVMRRRWAGVPFPFTHRHLRPAHHHHFPPSFLPATYRNDSPRPAPQNPKNPFRSATTQRLAAGRTLPFISVSILF